MNNKMVLTVFALAFFALNAGANKPESQKIQTLSDLIEGCPKEVQTNFYKSLFFVNGNLASMNIKNLEGCIASNNETVLGGLGKAADAESWEREGYACECNKSNQLGCHKKADWVCDSAFCWGDCDYSETRKYSFDEKYISIGEIFAEVPENIAREFAGGLVLNKGKVEQIAVSRKMAKYLDGEEIKRIVSILTGSDWEVMKKIGIMTEYISELRERSAKEPDFPRENIGKALAEKYDDLFGGQKLRFAKYDNETLKEFWNIYGTLISYTMERKYLSKAEAVFKNFVAREIHLTKCKKDGLDTCVEDLFSLYIKLGDFSSAKRLKQEYPDILKKSIIPD